MRLFLRLLLALALLCLALPAPAQDFNVSYNFPNAGTGGPKGQNFANTGINTWVIQWNPAAALSSCSIEVDSSSDNSTWGSGDVISTQSCTSAGSAAGSFSSSYVRINVTALSGAGLNVTLKGYHASSGGGSMTWPGGAAGIPNYSGASSWGSSYGASNTIPSNFIPTLTPSQVGLGSVTNDAQTKAAVMPNTAPTSGQIPVGNAGGNAYAPVTMSGDCTILSSGSISCVKTGGTAFGTLATIATGTLTSGDFCTYSSTGPTISCNSTAGGTGTVTSVTMAGTANQITVTGTCTVTTSGTCTFSLPNTVLLGTDASANGQLQLSNGGALGTHTIIGSAATTSNTFLFPAAVFANNDLGYCAVATTVCTWTDTGVLYTNLVTAASNFTNADLVQAAGANKTTSDSGIATANVVTQSSNAAANQICAYTGANKICIPTTTLPTAAFPALSGDVTNTAGSLSTTIANGAVTGAKMANNTVTATQLASQYSKHACPFGMGDGTNAITAATYPSSGQMLQCVNNSGVTWTITGIHCLTDNAGTSTLNVYNNAGTSLLTGAITCNATKTSGGAAGAQSATTTIANTDGINFVFVADGTSKYVTATVDFTY